MQDLIKIFASWTKLKIRIHLSEKNVYPKVKEIWWVSLGQNIGVETNGKNEKFERPVVVIKVFNSFGILVAPISSNVKEGKYFVKFTNDEGNKNIINISQIKSVSIKRFIRKIGKLKDEDFENIKRIYHSFV